MWGTCCSKIVCLKIYALNIWIISEKICYWFFFLTILKSATMNKYINPAGNQHLIHSVVKKSLKKHRKDCEWKKPKKVLNCLCDVSRREKLRSRCANARSKTNLRHLRFRFPFTKKTHKQIKSTTPDLEGIKIDT